MTARYASLLIVASVLALATLFCGGEPDPTPVPQVQAEPAATPIPPPEPTMTPLPPSPPTDTPIPTEPPAPVYQEPVTLLEISGTGEQVTDNYPMPVCIKAVFYWAVGASDIGMASLIADMYNADTGKQMPLVNALETDTTGELRGSTLQALAGGEYYFTAENTDQAWSIRIECQDGQAPAGLGIDIQGDGLAVTPNYELPACKKSVFNWSVEPNASGLGSIIIGLVGVDGPQYFSIANDIGMDLTAPLQGEALQVVSGGLYYLVVENVSGPWHIWWECQD